MKKKTGKILASVIVVLLAFTMLPMAAMAADALTVTFAEITAIDEIVFRTAALDGEVDATLKGNVEKNLAAVDISYESGKLSVSADKANMTEYNNGYAAGYWFPVLATFNTAASEVTGTGYSIEEKDYKEAKYFGAAEDGKSAVIWLDAGTATREMTFSGENYTALPLTVTVTDTSSAPSLAPSDEATEEQIKIEDNTAGGGAKTVEGSLVGDGQTPRTAAEVKAVFVNTETGGTTDIIIVKANTEGNDVELAPAAAVGTGCKIQLVDEDGAVLDEIVVIVPADTNGDGKAYGLGDLVQAMNHYVSENSNVFSDIQQKAADLNGIPGFGLGDLVIMMNAFINA